MDVIQNFMFCIYEIAIIYNYEHEEFLKNNIQAVLISFDQSHMTWTRF